MVFSVPLKVASGVLAVAGASAGAVILSNNASPSKPENVGSSSTETPSAKPVSNSKERQQSVVRPVQSIPQPTRTVVSGQTSSQELSRRLARFSNWPSPNFGSFSSRSGLNATGDTFSKKYPNVQLMTAAITDSAWNQKINKFKEKFKDKSAVYSEFDVSGDVDRYYGDVLNKYSPLSSGWTGEHYRYFLYHWCNDNKESRDGKVHELLKNWCAKE